MGSCYEICSRTSPKTKSKFQPYQHSNEQTFSAIFFKSLADHQEFTKRNKASLSDDVYWTYTLWKTKKYFNPLEYTTTIVYGRLSFCVVFVCWPYGMRFLSAFPENKQIPFYGCASSKNHFQKTQFKVIRST